MAKMVLDMLGFPVGGIAIDDPGRRGARPGALIPHICPHPTLHHPFADALGAAFGRQYADRCVVGVQNVAAKDRGLDRVNHGLQDPHRSAAPVGKCAARDIGAHTGEDLVLPI